MRRTYIVASFIIFCVLFTGCSLIHEPEKEQSISDEVEINNVLDQLEKMILACSQSATEQILELESLFTEKVVYNASNFADSSLSESSHAGEFLVTNIWVPLQYRLPKILDYRWENKRRDIILSKDVATVKAVGYIKADTDEFVYRLETSFMFVKSPNGKWLIKEIGQLFPEELRES